MHTCLLHAWLRRNCTSQPPQLWALISSSPGIQSQVLLVGCSPGCYPLVSALPKVSFRPALLCGSLKVFIFCLEGDRGRFDFSLGKRSPCVQCFFQNSGPLEAGAAAAGAVSISRLHLLFVSFCFSFFFSFSESTLKMLERERGRGENAQSTLEMRHFESLYLSAL